MKPKTMEGKMKVKDVKLKYSVRNKIGRKKLIFDLAKMALFWKKEDIKIYYLLKFLIMSLREGRL